MGWPFSCHILLTKCLEKGKIHSHKKPDISKIDLFRLIQIPSNTCLVIKYFFDYKIKATATMNDNIWNEAISVLWINNFSSITNQFNWNRKIEINSFWPWHVHSFFLFPVKLICWPLYWSSFFYFPGYCFFLGLEIPYRLKQPQSTVPCMSYLAFY